MNDEIKNKVRNAVSLYKDIFRDEYNQVVKEIDVARKNLKTEYAEVVYEDGRPSEGVKRELWRIPEKLYSTIIAMCQRRIGQLWILRNTPHGL